MLKIKNAIKRISILVCTTFVALTNMSLPVYASNNITTGKQILYSYRGYAENNPSYTYHGDYIAKAYVNGEIAFCVEPNVALDDIDSYYTQSNYTHEQRIIMERLAYAGWHMSEYKTDDDYVATQFMIWEAMGMRFSYNSFGGYEAKKEEINNRIKLFDKVPSFDNASLTLKVGESKTITDTKGVFEKYHFTSKSDGLTVKRDKDNKNKLTKNKFCLS